MQKQKSKHNKIISDISYAVKSSVSDIVSLRKERSKIQKEKEKLLAYQREMQLRPRVVNLRKQSIKIKDEDKFIAKGIVGQKNILKERTKNYRPSRILKLKKKLSFSRVFIFRPNFISFLIFAVLSMLAVKSLAFVDVSLKEKKNKILNEVNIASQYLYSGKDSILESDFSLASYKFKIAGERFFAAQKQINFLEKSIGNLLKFLPEGGEVSSSLNLLEAGGNISYAAENFSQAMEVFQNTEDIFASLKGRPKDTDKITFSDGLLEASRHLGLAVFRLEIAQNYLDKVKPEYLPQEKQNEVQEIKKTVPQLKESVNYFLGHLDTLMEILGHYQPKKYIIFFANPHEMRPVGGFLGTYGLFDVNEGRIENLKIQSPYIVSGQLKEKYQAPEPLRLIQPKFNFHDANWFFDFPRSAKKISLLHEKAGYPTADGIIIVSANMMPEILKITGPVSMPEYQTEIRADNFFDATQKEVEIEYDKKLNEPKRFIADLFPKILERAFSLDKKDQSQLLRIFLKELFEKNIVIYFQNEKLEKMVLDWGFGGEVKETQGDYLAVVETNIGGGKTDHVIDHKILHQAEIQPDGRIIETLTIEKNHQGDLKDFWTSIKSMNFMRIYVPLGSKLISAEGFDAQFFNPDILLAYEEGSLPDPDLEEVEKKQQIHEPSKTRIYQEGSKTVFGNWSGLEVGQKKTIVLRYELPFKIKLKGEPLLASYNLFVQKQSGALPFSFLSELYFPQDFSLLWKYARENNLDVKENKIRYETKLNTDRGYGAVFGEKSQED